MPPASPLPFLLNADSFFYPSSMAVKKPGGAFWRWFAVSAAVGVAVEILVSRIGRRSESWDTPYYWKVGVPVMMAGALVCGFFARRRPVRLGYAPFFGQLLAMVIKTGGGNMLPLGVIFSAILGISGVLAAAFGVALGRRVLKRPSS
jgi:hypothetical protein